MRSFLTQNLPGSGGRLCSTPDDFRVVEEISYPPSGEGDHVFFEIEKIGLDTITAGKRIVRALDLDDDALGFAGLKDRHALVRQWFSIYFPPHRGEPPLHLAESDDLKILRFERHQNKLRRGHQRANRFTIIIREVPSGGVAKAQQTLAHLKGTGVPNTFGPQRFGRDGDNAERAIAFIRRESRPPASRHIRKLLLSALQSKVFNHVLSTRIERGLLTTALEGDVMKKHDTGGLFDVVDVAAEQPRVNALEISPTAALPGKRTRQSSGEPQKMDENAIEACGLLPKDLPKLGRGTRRPLRYPLEDAEITPVGEDAFQVTVTLPSGAYATVLLDEIVKPSEGPFTRET